MFDFFISLISFTSGFSQRKSLETQVTSLLQGVNGKVGIGILNLSTGDTLLINNDHRYPMQSVYKLPLAMAVLREVDEGRLNLNDIIHVRKDDLQENTWSPMAEKFPDGNVNLKLHDIITYAVSLSDNNACDMLFRLMGGPKRVQQYLTKQLGLSSDEISVKNTEEEMHEDWQIQYNNYATPAALLQLLDTLNRSALSAPSKKFLFRTLHETPTGVDRIRGRLPEGTKVAHKTGTSSVLNGQLAAVNDVGIVTLPDGGSLAIVVLITDFNGSEKDAAAIISSISRTAYDYYTSQ